MYQENQKYVNAYNGAENREVEEIVKKYVPKTDSETAAEKIKKLDTAVEKKACILSVTIGVLGALVLGIGMCCTMIWHQTMFVPGIIIGVAGIAAVACAYPVYRKKAAKERQKIASTVLELSRNA